MEISNLVLIQDCCFFGGGEGGLLGNIREYFLVVAKGVHLHFISVERPGGVESLEKGRRGNILLLSNLTALFSKLKVDKAGGSWLVILSTPPGPISTINP